MTKPEFQAQHQREHEEPEEASNPVPMLVMVVAGLLALFGAVYIAQSSMSHSSTLGDGRSIEELQGPAAGAPGAQVDGAAVFASRCAACHQANGAGLPGVFPPLAKSEWVVGKESTLLAILIHGVTGPLTVNGVVFSGAMPAFGEQLTDDELAAVATHIRSQWGNSAEPVLAGSVSAARKEFEGRTGPFSGDADLASLK